MDSRASVPAIEADPFLAAVIRANGSREALGALLEGCRAYLLVLANESLGPELKRKEGASDLVQETFIQAQRHFEGFRGRTQPELLAWLRRILECQLSNARRRHHGTQMRDATRELPLDALSTDEARSALTGTGPSPSHHALRLESLMLLEQALARLPAHYRQVIALRHQDGRAFEEIGRALGCSTEAARKLWNRAIHQLRDELKAYL